MSGSEDTGYLKMFGIVLGALVVFTFLIGAIANMMSPGSAPDPLVAAQTSERLMPVGQSRISP